MDLGSIAVLQAQQWGEPSTLESGSLTCSEVRALHLYCYEVPWLSFEASMRIQRASRSSRGLVRDCLCMACGLLPSLLADAAKIG